MYRSIWIVCWLALLLPSAAVAEPEGEAPEEVNYCHDSGTWAEWDALITKHPHDLRIQGLHALRLGLCVKIERGELTVPEATHIFEQAREALVAQMEEQLRRQRQAEGKAL